MSGYEDVLVETLNLCCQYFENQMYVLPKEKYMLLKVRDIVCPYFIYGQGKFVVYLSKHSCFLQAVVFEWISEFWEAIMYIVCSCVHIVLIEPSIVMAVKETVVEFIYRDLTDM